MKLVLDSNVLISAIIFGGKPRIIFELIVIEKAAEGITSEALMKEMLNVLKSKFKYSKEELIKVEKLVKENFKVLNPKEIPHLIKDDPSDNQVLAIVDKAKIDLIVSGDRHLLNIKQYRNVPIVTPRDFVEKILKLP